MVQKAKKIAYNIKLGKKNDLLMPREEIYPCQAHVTRAGSLETLESGFTFELLS